MINLKNLRLEKGLTQEELCEDLKKVGYYINRSTYSKYETEKRNIPNVTLVVFAKYFETSTDYILGM